MWFVLVFVCLLINTRIIISVAPSSLIHSLGYLCVGDCSDSYRNLRLCFCVLIVKFQPKTSRWMGREQDDEFSRKPEVFRSLSREQIIHLVLYLVNILFDSARVRTVRMNTRNIRLKHRIACNGVKYMMLENSVVIDAWKIHNNKC